MLTVSVLTLGWTLFLALFVLVWAANGRRSREVAGIDEHRYLNGLDEVSLPDTTRSSMASPRRRSTGVGQAQRGAA